MPNILIRNFAFDFLLYILVFFKRSDMGEIMNLFCTMSSLISGAIKSLFIVHKRHEKISQVTMLNLNL